jgi:hypothetical protein
MSTTHAVCLQPARGGLSAAVLGRSLVVFGGETRERRLLNDLHVLNLETREWAAPATRSESYNTAQSLTKGRGV